MRGIRFGAPAIIAVIILIAAVARIAPVEFGSLWHPDEIITISVVDRLRNADSLDTNWKNADLPAQFRVPQYNFSGYFLAVFAASAVTDAIAGNPRSGAAQLHRYRLLSVAFSLACLVFVAWAGLAIAGKPAAIIGTALAALSPSLLMDSFYARPESFATLLSLALLAIVLQRNEIGRWWGPIAGFLVGFLVAVKVSFLCFYILLLPGMLSFCWQERDGAAPVRSGLKASPAGILAVNASVLLGFAVGAPGAIANMADYLAGIRALQNQYGSGHWPHGLGVEAGFLERCLYGARFLAETWGLALPFCALGFAVLWKRGRWDVLFALTPFVVILAYFASTPVFFERNFSPALAALAPVAGLGVVEASRYLGERVQAGERWRRDAAWIAVLGASALVVPILISERVLAATLSPNDPELQRRRVGDKFGARIDNVDWGRPELDGSEGMSKDGCDRMLIEIRDPGDSRTPKWLADAFKKGWVEVARHRSYFSGMVPSTFHTYFAPDSVWLIQSQHLLPGCLVPIANVTVHADGGWRRNGYFPGLQRLPSAGSAFGSWIDSDRSTGAIAFGPVRLCETLVVPYMTGPEGRRQAMTVEVWNDQFKATHAPPLDSGHRWSYFQVPVPLDCAWVKITGVDAGSGYGEWMAVGVPHRLSRQSSTGSGM